MTYKTLGRTLCDIATANHLKAELKSISEGYTKFTLNLTEYYCIHNGAEVGYFSIFEVDMFTDRVELGVSQMFLTCKYEDIESVEVENRKLVIKLTNGMVIRTINV